MKKSEYYVMSHGAVCRVWNVRYRFTFIDQNPNGKVGRIVLIHTEGDTREKEVEHPLYYSLARCLAAQTLRQNKWTKAKQEEQARRRHNADAQPALL